MSNHLAGELVQCYSWPVSDCWLLKSFNSVNDGCIMLHLVSVVAKDHYCFRLHRILYNVLHSKDSDWVPSLLVTTRVFVNYGTY